MRLPDETRELLQWVNGGLLGDDPQPADTEAVEGPYLGDEPGGSATETDLEDSDADTADADGEVVDPTDDITADDESDGPQDDAATADSPDDDIDIENGLSEPSEAEPADTDRADDDLDLADALDELDPDDTEESSSGASDGGGHVEELPFNDTVADRNDRIDEYSGDCTHKNIRQRLRDSGVAERLQQELADLFRGSRTQVQPWQNLGRPDTDVVGGRPAMRKIVRRFAGDLRVRDVFERPSPGQDADVAVGIVLDLSSSMGQDDAEADAKAAAGAFLFAIEQFGGETVAVSYPTLDAGTVTSLMTGARERFRWEHLDSGRPNGGTPTSQAVVDGAELLAECSADRYLLIVLTDGGAASPLRTRNAVDAVRDRGREWAVVGFGYGGIQEDKLETQFGEDGYRAVEIEDLPTELADVYREQHPGL